ncbi:XRE family transcriptional regulator [Clavibacter michiganensis subsp. phaseoli]|uniref:helix-turn-helix domain-containing protein n=1 Tax=Clavibacter phaseoli TaxID=1734031 RepID=UPI001FB2F7A5|nr:XRE family transcriptional regulator [Clavibacter phaseoli]MCJ1711150.1 XRE family transcriptional regulator [Clavibacter phaseoli]
MDTSGEILMPVIGSRIRAARQAREWTLDQLAQHSGVSRRQIINVEQGDANPSIATLLSLSDALGVGLPALVETPSVAATRITRAGEGAALWTGDRGGRGVLLAGTHPPDVVELWEWTMNPGEGHTSAPHRDGTRELLHVHTGTVTLVVSDEPIELAVGDAVAFPGDVEHAYRNDGADATRFTLTVFEPAVGQLTAPKGHHA